MIDQLSSDVLARIDLLSIAIEVGGEYLTLLMSDDARVITMMQAQGTMLKASPPVPDSQRLVLSLTSSHKIPSSSLSFHLISFIRFTKL